MADNRKNTGNVRRQGKDCCPGRKEAAKRRNKDVRAYGG